MQSLIALLTALVVGFVAQVAVAQTQPAEGVAKPKAPVEGAASQPAEAAPPRASKPPNVEEIVVRAGQSESAADVQAANSVTGFNASDLEALGAQSVEDLAGFTPNLEIVTTGATTPTFFIRGVGLNDFNANSASSVAIFHDDVPMNSPALQLGTLFDVAAVNVVRGPQGTGAYRGASAGAIKIYSRRPSGGFGGYLRSELGNYNYRNFEGAVEMPLFEDIISSRLAFRFSKRDGYATNNCGNAPPIDQRPVFSSPPGSINTDLIRIFTPQLVQEIKDVTGQTLHVGASVCGESVYRTPLVDQNTGLPSTGVSYIPPGLPTKVNDLGNWATRGTVLIQPTLDQEWLVTVNVSQRDELSRLGQTIGTAGTHYLCPVTAATRSQCLVSETLGGTDGLGYRSIEILRQLKSMNPCLYNYPTSQRSLSNGTCTFAESQQATNDVALAVQSSLKNLDSKPFSGDYDRVGRTKNDVWGASLRGTIDAPGGLHVKTVSAFDTYRRLVDQDLDQSPNRLFEVATRDKGWQVSQDLELSGALPGPLSPVLWNMGGLFLVENLKADTNIYLPLAVQTFGVDRRTWNQDLVSFGGYAGFSWNFWRDFTLDGGARYNWEQKSMNLQAFTGSPGFNPKFADKKIWQAPTGQIRLTYRFREDTQAYWKYSRGWKGGHYNVTVNAFRGFTTADPETIDSFETGLQGAWFDGRLSLDSSLFHYNYESYQIFTVQVPLIGSPEFVVLNAANTEVLGAEADIVARPLPGTYLEARFSWLESHFVDFVQTTAVTVVKSLTQSEQIVRQIDNSGHALLNSPEFKLSLTAEQTLPLGRYGSLTARWDGAWTATNYFDATQGAGFGTYDGKQFLPDDTIAQTPFWLHNFSLDYRTPDGSITLGGWVHNATDVVYKTFAFDASALEANRTTIYFLGEPRTFGGSLTIAF